MLFQSCINWKSRTSP